MTKNPRAIGIVETKYFTFADPPKELTLESGERLGPITLAYETYGTLNDEESNAIPGFSSYLYELGSRTLGARSHGTIGVFLRAGVITKLCESPKNQTPHSVGT